MIKHIVAPLITLAMVFTLSACDKKDEKEATPDSAKTLMSIAAIEKVTKDEAAPIWHYANINGNLPNITMIEGADGLIIVDTGLRMEDAKKTLGMIREQTDKLVKAIVYTHHHPDHINGAAAFIEDQNPDDVLIIGAHNLNAEARDENSVTGRIMGFRAMYMYGSLLDPEGDGKNFQVGVGGKVIPGSNGFIPVNTPFTGSTDITVSGIKMHLFQTGGEAASHIAVYLPDFSVMLSGDELQGPTYPNLHSLRGTKPRDANNWINALDKMLDFHPKSLVPGHGPVIEGAAEIDEILTIYRDAIQWTHDQAVRLINMGYTQEELAEALPALPASLQLEPYTTEYYGTVKHSVRNYFTGYISWFDGDAATLDPTPRIERSVRYVALMGGRDKVMAEAELAKTNGDAQWAAELTTHLIRIKNDDSQARSLKAWAFRQLSDKTVNTNWKGFYLTGAMELEGNLDSVAIQKAMRKFFAPEHVGSEGVLGLMRYIVDAEKAEGKHLSVAFNFTDTNEIFTFELRNQILVLTKGKRDDVTATFNMKRGLYNDILKLEANFLSEIVGDGISIDGSKLDALAFLGVLDSDIKPLPLVVR